MDASSRSSGLRRTLETDRIHTYVSVLQVGDVVTMLELRGWEAAPRTSRTCSAWRVARWRLFDLAGLINAGVRRGVLGVVSVGSGLLVRLVGLLRLVVGLGDLGHEVLGVSRDGVSRYSAFYADTFNFVHRYMKDPHCEAGA